MVTFRIKCTSCQKTEDMTADQEREAAINGVPFSRCCQAVATVERVTFKAGRAKAGGNDKRGPTTPTSARPNRR